MSRNGSTCKICEDTVGIGIHFGTSFLCLHCEEEMWVFIRSAIKAIKSKPKHK